MRIIISEEEKKSILSLHSSYGYKSFINEQELTPSRPESPDNAQGEPVGQEQDVVRIDAVDIVQKASTNYIAGVVKDEDGNPIPNVKITVTDKNGNNVYTYKNPKDNTETKINREKITNDKGEYKIIGITTEDSPYTLTASLEGYNTSNKKFRKGDKAGKMDLTMEKPKAPKPPKPEKPAKPDNTEEPTTTPEETKPAKPLSKRSMERLNSKVFKELVDEFKRENLIFYIQTSETGQDPLQLEIDKGGNFQVDYNPSVVTIPTKDPKNNLPNGNIVFDCNMKPVILMRMGEESYKSSLKYKGKPYYQIQMPKKYGNDWIKTNYCDRLVSRLEDGQIVAPYDNR